MAGRTEHAHALSMHAGHTGAAAAVKGNFITREDVASRIREVADLYRGANGTISAVFPMASALADLFLDIHEDLSVASRHT